MQEEAAGLSKKKDQHEKSLVFLGRKSCMAVCLLITPGVPMLSVQPKGKQKGCAGCNRKIKDRYLLKALDKYWHEDCLKCACCDCRLGEVGSTLYTKANLILCRRDYLRQERHTPRCTPDTHKRRVISRAASRRKVKGFRVAG